MKYERDGDNMGVNVSPGTHPTAVGTAALSAGQVDVDGRNEDLTAEEREASYLRYVMRERITFP